MDEYTAIAIIITLHNDEMKEEIELLSFINKLGLLVTFNKFLKISFHFFSTASSECDILIFCIACSTEYENSLNSIFL